MYSIHQAFQVRYTYDVHFTRGVFGLTNPLLKDTIRQSDHGQAAKVLVVLDAGVAAYNPTLLSDIKAYTATHPTHMQLMGDPILIPSGEACKNDTVYLETVKAAINQHGIDRHAYIIAIGGGALLDMAGFAAAISHRGVRLIRIPTTVLAQNDSGVGVKNSINAFNKKNFLGTFAPPFAVINDFDFLATLNDRNWRAGIAEAIKVSLIKDRAFFEFLQQHAAALVARAMPPMESLIIRCAELHLNHIASGDPFEFGSSRPLDFGHWSAHKLEQITDYSILHGEAVAIGIAIDTLYAHRIGLLPEADKDAIINLLLAFGFVLHVPALDWAHPDRPGQLQILEGLNEFREHLGGQLTIMLLRGIGEGIEVHEIDYGQMQAAIQDLRGL